MFGSCPRVYCNGCNVVPCGRSDLPGLDTVKLFCPNCNDIYTPPSSRFQGVDGRPSLILTSASRSCMYLLQARSLGQHSRISSSKATASLRQLHFTDHIPLQALQDLLILPLALLANPPPSSTRTPMGAKSALQAKSMFPRSMASRLANGPRVGRGCNGCA